MVLVVASPQPGANYIAITDEFHRRVEMIKRSLPEDIEVAWAFDASRYVRKSVAEVQQTIFIAFGLVMLVIFLFLRDWRTTLIPVVVIPVSLIGSFFVMYLAGFTLNVLTLFALVLAIGLVVDDAIVVVEVIYAKIEGGLDPQEGRGRGHAGRSSSRWSRRPWPWSRSSCRSCFSVDWSAGSSVSSA